MYIFSLKKNNSRIFARITSLIIALFVVISIIPAADVLAYHTVGALGRSLDRYPGFSVNSSLMAPLGTPCRSGQQLTGFNGVTIHETSNWSANANAEMHAKYLRGSGANYEVSWHYSVDSVGAFQSVPENEKAWHAGDTGKGKGNATTIAIEICDNSNGNFDQAMANAEWLAADILYRHGVYNVSGFLYQHNDFSSYGKNCPITIRDTGRWGEFVAKTQGFLDAMVVAGGRFSIRSDHGDFIISGSPVNSDTVARVDVYADGATSLGSYSMANGSFSGKADAALMKPGWHTIMYAIINKDNTARWSCVDYLVGPPSYLCIDAPGTSTLYGNVSVNGWAISHASISHVEIYLDNQLIGSDYEMSERADVDQALNVSGLYKDALHCGYSYEIDRKILTKGTHTLKVVAVSKDGSKKEEERKIDIGINAAICIDLPKTNTVIGQDIQVTGWAIDTAGVASVEFFLDNKSVGKTSVFSERPDVEMIVNALNIYFDALHSGFSYSIDAGQATVGEHIFKAVATSTDGVTEQTEFKIQVGPVSQMCLDAPSGNEVSGDFFVHGWAVSHAGISRVEVYDETNKLLASTQILFERPDVNTGINGSDMYKNALHSGFSILIPGDKLSWGEHTLNIVAISNDGSEQQIQKKLSVGAPPITCVDYPLDATIVGPVTVRGWSLAYSGISRIDFYADDYRWIGSTSDLYEREDVNRIMNSSGIYKNGIHSGYTITINANYFSPGQHIIRIASIANDGTVFWTQKTINIGMPGCMCLDHPTEGSYKSDILVQGWAVSYSEVTAVNIYSDGILIGTQNKLYERADVTAAVNTTGIYPDNSGNAFTYIIPSGTLATGSHVLRVEAKSVDGSVQSVTVTVFVS